MRKSRVNVMVDPKKVLEGNEIQCNDRRNQKLELEMKVTRNPFLCYLTRSLSVDFHYFPKVEKVGLFNGWKIM